MDIIINPRLLKLSVLILFPFLTTVLCKNPPPWTPQPQTETEDWVPWNWDDRFKANVNSSATNANNATVLFYGDSITDGWNYTEPARAIWDKVYAPLGSVNYGIGGDRIEHLLWRLVNGETDKLSPKLCVLRIGTNNVGIHNEHEIARGIAAVVTQLIARHPSMKVLLLGILPRENSERTNFVERVNAMISILDNGTTIRFLNMHDAYYNLGIFKKELYDEDMIHLSEGGYRVWQENMNELFNEMYKN